MASTRVLIVGDRGVTSVGVESLIAKEQDLVVVGIASNFEEGLLKARLLLPDVAVLCFSALLDNECRRFCDEIIEPHCETRIFVVGASPNPAEALTYLSRGVTGYVVESTPAELLINDLRRVALGEPVVRGVIFGQNSIKEVSSGSIKSDKSNLLAQFSRSELNILQLVMLGQSNKQIAHSLSLSEATVKWHLSRVYQKLGVAGRSEAIVFGLQMGINSSTAKGA